LAWNSGCPAAHACPDVRFVDLCGIEKSLRVLAVDARSEEQIEKIGIDALVAFHEAHELQCF
jgi:hypothetical protein